MTIAITVRAGMPQIAAAILAATVGVPSYAQDKGPIKIGLILTYKGVYAPVSEGFDRGLQIAIAEYGGKIASRAIEIIRADDELTPSVGVQKFNKLVQLDKVDF